MQIKFASDQKSWWEGKPSEGSHSSLFRYDLRKMTGTSWKYQRYILSCPRPLTASSCRTTRRLAAQFMCPSLDNCPLLRKVRHSQS